MNCVVFSKDRAMQLDALLRSMKMNCSSVRPTSIIYSASTGLFHDSYCKLVGHSGLGYGVWEWQTNNFRDHVLTVINPKSRYTMFLVDDDLFYRVMPAIPELRPGEAYAPRLGTNCTWCYNRQCTMSWERGDYDFDCSLSLDGHVYRTEEILPLIESAKFRTPGQLEDALWRMRTFDLKYADHSCLVGIPHNLVGEYPNRNAGGSAQELNQRFLAGDRIDLDAMDFSNVVGVHQEIPYVFTKALGT